ncbi:MAG: hypothetical protein JNL08_12795 [Planctomycetes bacterium]|nr:hypothetical protein [Planctomycetota bacterium]
MLALRSLFVFLVLGAVGAQAPLSVELTRKGEPPLAATWSAPALTVDTEYGSATVKPDKLEQIVFGEPDVVVAAGVEVRGKLKLARIDVKVDGKARKFTPRELESLVVVRDGSARGAATFTGAWMTTFGPAELVQRGLTVTGSYGHDGKGEIEGKLEQGALRFRWRDGSGSGDGSWELQPADQAFTGKLGGDGNFWGGYRKAPQRANAEPGKVASGQTDAGMRYHVRLPKAHTGAAKWPAICILHGSNMDSRAYVDTIVAAWPELAEEFVVVGLDGENLSPASKPGALRFNYSYVNFGGPDAGPLWARRQSPALVAEALQQLQRELPITQWYLGGHSQGGFLTYCLVMFYPELLAGAFPMSCNLLVQCEPDNFRADAVQKQHRVPVAVVHGRADDVVEFDSGAYCHLRLVDGGFPFVRLFAPERIGHQFGLLPVDTAVRWLRQCASDDAETVLKGGEAAAQEQRWRDVGAVLARLATLRGDAARTAALQKRLDDAVRPALAEVDKAIGKQKDGKWIDGFLEFRAAFGTAEAASRVLDGYAKLRAQQEKLGDELFGEWRGERDQAARKALFARVAAECYATKWYEAMKLWSR